MKKEKTEKTKKTGKTETGKKTKAPRRGKKKEAAAPVRTTPEKTGNIAQWRKDFVLERRQETREKQRQADEQERLQVFVRRTKAASGHKAQRTERTRSFYRFTKTYPANVDTEGFRENTDTLGKRKKPWVYLLCGLLVFCFAFIITKTCLMISQEPPANEIADDDGAPPSSQLRILRFSYDAYSAGNAEAVVAELGTQGCNTALFEIKPVSGYVNLAMPEFAAAGKREIDPSHMLEEIRDAGCSTCAYISCFLDPLAANWEISMAVRRTDAGGEVWTDNAGNAWLNPFSQSARTYLCQIAAAAAKAGFDYIMLDNVCFSSDSGTAMAYYPGEEGAGAGASRNEALTAFVDAVVKSASSARVIVMCRYSAFDPLANTDLPAYGGNLLQTTASALCVDARLSFQQKNITVGTERFTDVSTLPFVFTLAAGDYASQGITDALSGADCMICIEKEDPPGDATRALKLTNLYGYVLW